MKENNKKEYDTPMVEHFEARVEKGFAGSGGAAERQTAGSTEGLSSSSSYNYSNFD